MKPALCRVPSGLLSAIFQALSKRKTLGKAASLPSVKKNNLQRRFLPSTKQNTRQKRFLLSVFFTRQTII